MASMTLSFNKKTSQSRNNFLFTFRKTILDKSEVFQYEAENFWIDFSNTNAHILFI